MGRRDSKQRHRRDVPDALACPTDEIEKRDYADYQKQKNETALCPILDATCGHSERSGVGESRSASFRFRNGIPRLRSE
jgi:hypothetical protein